MFEVLKNFVQAAPAAPPDLSSHLATVQVGETTLQQVARRLNVDPDDLLLANPQIKDPFKLSPGQDIYMPLPQPAAPSTSVPAPAAGNQPAPSNTNPPPKGDPTGASLRKAALQNADALPGDEQAIKTFYGDDALKLYQQTKAKQAEVMQAHDIYQKTGQIPQTKTPFSWIEIKEGKLMSRSERYDAMLKKQGKENPELGDVTGDNRDPEYLTKQEFHDEFWARETKEYNNCSDEYTRPGKIDKCQRAVDEKYGGPGFKEWRDGQERAAYRDYQNVQQKIDGVANSGPVSLAGRAIGQAIGGDEGGEIGAAVGGVLDMGLAVRAGQVEMARRDSYQGTGGLEVRQETPAHVESSPPSNPAAETPDPPAQPKNKQPIAYDKTQPQAGPPPDPPPAGGNRGRPLDSTVRQGPVTVDTSSPGSSDSSGSSSGSVSGGQPAGTPVRIAPVSRPADNEQVTVNTSSGPKQMTAGEYRRLYHEAEQWVSKQLTDHHWTGANKPAAPDYGEIYRQAADKFGLDRNWRSVNNPIIYGK